MNPEFLTQNSIETRLSHKQNMHLSCIPPIKNDFVRMEKSIRTIVGILMIMGIISGCKKSTATKDYVLSVKERTWWGLITHTGQSSEYYSVHFNADNSFVWSEMSGDIQGNWSLAGKQVTITFSGSGAQIKANISDNDTLLNIFDNSDLYSIKSGYLIETPIVFLDNTIWKGSITSAGNPPLQLQINYLPNFTVTSSLGSNAPFSYSRSESDAVVRFYLDATYKFFGVIVSTTEMKGTEVAPDYHWQVTKQ